MHSKDQLGYKRRLKRKSIRPLSITILCILIVFFGLWNIITMYVNIYKGPYAIYPAVNALMVVFSFVAISGVWAMEKWGAITFPVVLILKMIADVIFAKFIIWYLIGFLPAIYFLKFYRQMKRAE